MSSLFSPEIWGIVALSVQVSLVAMLFTLPLATAVAYLLVWFYLCVQLDGCGVGCWGNVIPAGDAAYSVGV